MLEAREMFYTPAHCLGLWGYKLRRHWGEGLTLAPLEVPAGDVDLPSGESEPQVTTNPIEALATPAAAEPVSTSPAPSKAQEVAVGQLGFDFAL